MKSLFSSYKIIPPGVIYIRMDDIEAKGSAIVKKYNLRRTKIVLKFDYFFSSGLIMYKYLIAKKPPDFLQQISSSAPYSEVEQFVYI